MDESLANFDRSYQEAKDKIIFSVVVMGLVGTLVGTVHNGIYGYPFGTVLIHLVGFILLLFLLIRYKYINKNTMIIVVLLYFCLVYTPFAWLLLDGVYGSMSYVVYVFFLLFFFLLEGKAVKIFVVGYYIEVVLLLLRDILDPPFSDPITPIFPMVFSYLIMLSILVIVSGIFKNQINNFLLLNHQNAVTDVLSGLYNYRFLSGLLDGLEKEYAAENAKDYSVAVLDLDDFKSINDTYGHSIGDDIIREIGPIFTDVFHPCPVGRYGGDEFVVVFKDLEFDRCIKKCEVFLNNIENKKLTELGIKITFSVGLCRRSKVQSDGIFTEADRLLYSAKKEGKNRLVFCN